MHDIKFIRDNPVSFDKNLAKRGVEPFSKTILLLDNKRRKFQTSIQEKQKLRNDISKNISVIKSQGGNVEELFSKVSQIKSEISEYEQSENELAGKLNKHLLELPNMIDEDLPIGGEENNKTLRKWGDINDFEFTPKDHVELGEKLSGIDFSNATKLSGSRFVILKGLIAKLERALANFMIDTHTTTFDYTEIMPPALVNENTMTGTGQLPKFSDDLFKTIDNRWLIPTAEVPLTNIVANTIVPRKSLPLRFTAYTQCFRAEAGAAGRDTRGMIRNHQFSKVEMVSICDEEGSEDELERMTSAAENILKLLNLPYRVVLLASNDIGFSAKRTYDLEVWLPGQNDGKGIYREISSCSNCGSFQARRMKARYKDNDENKFLHTLNGSGLAVGRTIIAILENGQLPNGDVLLPEVLHEYMKTDKLLAN
jgi:seryl-tRNA synthetase